MLTSLKRYKVEIGRLKDERKMLFARADSLIQSNRMLAVQWTAPRPLLGKPLKWVDSVSQENLAMAETIKKDRW